MEQDLMTRIESLERGRRRSGAACLALSLIAVVAVLSGADESPRVEALIGTSLTLVGDDRTPLIELSADDAGGWLHIRDGHGRLMAALGHTQGAGRLMLLDQKEAVLASVGPSRTGDGQLALGGAASGTQVRLGSWSQTGPQLWFKSRSAPGQATP